MSTTVLRSALERMLKRYEADLAGVRAKKSLVFDNSAELAWARARRDVCADLLAELPTFEAVATSVQP